VFSFQCSVFSDYLPPPVTLVGKGSIRITHHASRTASPL